MNYSTVCLCAFLFCFVTNNYQCLKVIPERAELIYFDKTYIEDSPCPIFNVRRYKRKGDYYVNLIFTSKTVWDNTFEIEILFYEYLHNEFRRSFPEMHFKLCDLINFDPYFGETLRMMGMKTCPIPPGKYDMSNLTFNHKIPSVWPFEKGMIKSFLKNTNHQVIAEGVIVVTFKQDLPKFKT